MTESSLAWGRNHALYIAMAGWETSDGGDAAGNLSVVVSRSTDFGDTWTKAVARDNRGKTGKNVETDRAVSGLAVDATTGNQDSVYVTYRRNQPGLPSRALVVVSTDAGRTFSDPVDVAAPFIAVPGNIQDVTLAQDVPNNVTGFNPEVKVDNKGDIYLMWEQRTSNVTPAPNFAHFQSRSSDHGKTWTTTLAYPLDAQPGGRAVRLEPARRPQWDPPRRVARQTGPDPGRHRHLLPAVDRRRGDLEYSDPAELRRPRRPADPPPAEHQRRPQRPRRRRLVGLPQRSGNLFQ